MSHATPPDADLLLPLRDRTILVTGGSRGIGAATVRALHRDGATVVLSYGSNKEAARAVATSLGERVLLLHADLAVPGSADRLWDEALAADHLAATDASALPLGEPTPPEDVAEVIAFLASGRSRHSTGTTIDITGADYVR